MILWYLISNNHQPSKTQSSVIQDSRGISSHPHWSINQSDFINMHLSDWRIIMSTAPENVRTERLLSLSSVWTDFKCIKEMMINFNITNSIRLKSIYELLRVLMFTWSQINTIALQLPQQLFASSHYTSSLSVTKICHPDCRGARAFIAIPGRAHVQTCLSRKNH